MISVDDLKNFGCDTETGIKRCASKESLYLKLIAKIPNNEGFIKLKEAILNKDLDIAFDAAHGLKGIITNLSITPLEKPIIEITELLRERKDIDYTSYIEEIEKIRIEFEKLFL